MPSTSSQPDEPCGCGSGKPQVNCHGPILEAPLLRKVPVAQKIYVREWSVNAEHYRSQGLYEALAAELMASADVHRLLDIGCGLGQGLEALNRRLPEESGSLLVGIDENPDCISGSAARLEVAPREVSNHRLKSRKTLSGYLDSEVSTSRLKGDGRVVLVNADLMVADPSLDRWLDGAGPFDAVTLWFSGIHKARALTKVARMIGAASDRDLREALEVRVMEFAARHLRPGGVVQIVRRCAGEMESERRAWEAEVASAVKDRPFDPVGVTARQYEEPRDPNAITMASVAFDPRGMPNFVLSMLLRRRDSGI